MRETDPPTSHHLPDRICRYCHAPLTDEEAAGLPTAAQFREVAARFRTAVVYGLSGMTIGDNEVARAVLACEIVAAAITKAEGRQYPPFDHSFTPVGGENE